MIDFWKRTNELIRKNATSQEKIANEIEVSKNTLYSWIQGDRLPRVEHAAKIASILGTTIEFLLIGIKSYEKLTADEIALLEKYHSFDERDKIVVRAVVSSLETAQKPQEAQPEQSGTTLIHLIEPDSADAAKITTDVHFLESGFEYIPYYGKTAAGKPIDINGDPLALVLYPKAIIKKNPDDYFALVVSGFSMTEAGINDGDMVLLRREKEPMDGKIMLVRYDNTSTLKRILIKGKDVYICWEDGTNRKERVTTEDCAIEGILERISKLPE